MAVKTKLSSKNYKLTIEFQVDVTARHMVDAEEQGWEGRLKINGNGNLEPVNVEVERVGEY